jgi:hypothetical protein
MNSIEDIENQADFNNFLHRNKSASNISAGSQEALIRPLLARLQRKLASVATFSHPSETKQESVTFYKLLTINNYP